MKSTLKQYKSLLILAAIAIAIGGLILAHYIKKNMERNRLLSEREEACVTFGDRIPEMLLDKCEGISEAEVSVNAAEDTHNYTNYKDEADYYYVWTDTLTITCRADDLFKKGSDGYRLTCMQKILSAAAEAADEIRASDFPFYNEYYNRSEIVDLFDSGVFCGQELAVYVTDGGDRYEYTQYKDKPIDEFKKNGITVDLSGKSFSDYVKKDYSGSSAGSSSGSQSSGSHSSSGSSSSGSHSLNNDPDDYDDPEEYADDAWGDDFDDWDDAYEFWENW